LAICCKHFIF